MEEGSKGLCCLDADGRMVAGKQTIGGKAHTFDASGAWAGWLAMDARTCDGEILEKSGSAAEALDACLLPRAGGHGA